MVCEPPKHVEVSSVSSAMPRGFLLLLLLGCALILACQPTPGRPPNAVQAVQENAAKVAVRWTTSNAEQERVRVGVVIAEKPVSLGELEGASDMEPGGASTCDVEQRSETETRLTCGCTPFYNYLTLTLRDRELIVTRTSGVESDPPETEKNEIVYRQKTDGKAIVLFSPPTPPDKFKSCKPHER